MLHPHNCRLVKSAGLGFALLWLATPAAATTVYDVSAAGTVDSRPPVVTITFPAGGETLYTSTPDTLTWSIDEQSWGSAPTPVVYSVICGEDVLDQDSLPAELSGDYAVIWALDLPGVPGSQLTAQLVVGASDCFGWGGADTSAAFTIVDDADDWPGKKPSSRLISVQPNLFSPGTTIAFNLVEPAGIDLAVFDVRGRRVAMLYEGQREAGEHRVLWTGRGADGRHVASGIYFARLTVRSGADREQSFVTRMLLVK